MKSFKDFISEDTLKENKSDEFLETFNLKAAEKTVNAVIKKAIGIDAGIKLDIGMGRNGKNVSIISSADLAPRMIPRIVKSLKVESKGSNIDRDGDYWIISVGYRYEHFDGGSNGTNIAVIGIKQDGSLSDARYIIK